MGVTVPVHMLAGNQEAHWTALDGAQWLLNDWLGIVGYNEGFSLPEKWNKLFG